MVKVISLKGVDSRVSNVVESCRIPVLGAIGDYKFSDEPEETVDDEVVQKTLKTLLKSSHKVVTSGGMW